MGQSKSAIVVGGGIIGVTSAYALARDGWLVQIMDARSGVAEGASWGNGRQLSYSHTNALASPHILAQMPSLLLGCDDAFKLNLRADQSFCRWIFQFLANCNAPAHSRNTLQTLELAEQSRIAMGRLLDQHPIEFARKQAGKLVLLRSEAELQLARSSHRIKLAAGLKQELLTRDDAIAVEPTLEQACEPLLGALYSPGDETGDCHTFAEGLLKVGTSEYGIQFHGGTSVSRIRKDADQSIVELSTGQECRADLVVIANGHDLNRLLSPIGHAQPVEPMKGYSFTAPLGNAAPLASVTDHKRRIVFTHLGDRMLVAGIAELGSFDASVDPRRVHNIVKAARASLPQAAVYDQVDQGWAGLRPMTPNSQPITRMLEPGIAVNGGHGMLGWTLAMGSAERLVQVVRQAA